jgi:hypothetical protein
MRPTFAFVALFVLFLSSACADRTAKVTGRVPNGRDPERIEWGSEIKLDELLALAKSGRIREVEWHVMPNVIRAVASDGRVFHFKNANRGVDLRNLLVNGGIQIGKGGISFRHVF